MAQGDGTITVFLADDHEVLREGLTQLLQMQPDLRVVGSSADGRESLAQILALQPQVAVLDISMPGLNGIEIAEALAKTPSQAALLMLSVHDSTEYVFRALAAGAKGYLQKESASAEIVAAIHALRAGRRYVSSKIAGVLADQASGTGAKSALQSLTPRERQILQLVAEGNSSAEIGRKLHLSPKTVDTYRSRLMVKIGADDLVTLLRFALRHGLIPL